MQRSNIERVLLKKNVNVICRRDLSKEQVTLFAVKPSTIKGA